MKFRKSIFFKNFFITISLTLLITTPLNISLFYKLINNARTLSASYMYNDLNNASQSIDTLLFDIDFFSSAIATDTDILNKLNVLNSATLDYEKYSALSSIKSFLYSRTIQENYLYKVNLYQESTNSFFSSSLFDFSSQEDITLHENFLETSTPKTWYYDDSNLHGEKNFAIYRDMYDFHENNLVGKITCYVKIDNLKTIFENQMNELDKYTVLDDKNQTVFGDTIDIENLNAKQITPYASISKDYLICTFKSEYSNLTYYTFKNMEDLIKPFNFISQIFFINILLSIIISTAIFLFMAHKYYKLFSSLNEKMNLFSEGDFKQRIEITTDDEFGNVALGFNSMAERVQYLIEEVYLKTLLGKKSQLKAIQIEINEHFLYNTLDLIHWMCKRNEVENIDNIVRKLSTYFRYSLNNGNDEVTIKEVVNIIESYIDIINIRFQNLYDFKITIDDKLLHIKVLKYIFQPIVENAIVHGMKNKKEKGTINISIELVHNFIIFTVEDNGMGIPEEKLLDILTDMKKSNIESNYSFHNIYQQIRLFYSIDDPITIESQLDKGTLVRIKIPVNIQEKIDYV